MSTNEGVPIRLEALRLALGCVAPNAAVSKAKDFERFLRGDESPSVDTEESTSKGCMAHGTVACVWCSLIRSEFLTQSGGCTGCGKSFRETGMHWDTCPNRMRETTIPMTIYEFEEVQRARSRASE